jgi:hypothetical protein
MLNFYSKFRKKSLKGLCHEMNILLKICKNKQGFPVRALIVFTIFGFLIDEKIELRGLACSFEITYKF